jgi:lipoprotein NlpI
MNAAIALAGMLLAAATPATVPNSRAYLPNFTVNGQPAAMMVDTGATSSFLFDSSVPWLDLEFTPAPAPNPKIAPAAESAALGLSAVAQVKVGLDSFSAPFEIFSGDLWNTTFPQKLDGAIGWPEIRANLLVFDSASHTLSAPDTLPDTTGWLKFTVHPANVLLLEVPQPDGQTGLLLVDTSRPGGIALLPPQWQEWTAARPQAALSSVTLLHPTAPADRAKITTTMAWADEVHLGPLTLTQVSIEQADPRELEGLDQPLGIIGLGALERIDLIVDGPHNVAYLRAKPPATTPAPPTDWTVAASVRLNPAHLLADASLFKAQLEFQADDYDAAIADFGRTLELDPRNQFAAFDRGVVKMRKNDAAGAIADFSLVIAINPHSVPAYGDRAVAKQSTGDFTGAIADFTRILELDPKDGLIYYDRGFAKILQGDFAGALPDLDQAIALGQKDAKTYANRAKARYAQDDFEGAAADYATVIRLQPDATYPRFFLALALRRLHRSDAPAGLAEAVPTWKAGWPKTIGLFFTGALTEASFLTAAQDDPKTASQHQCEAFYYAGMIHLLKNENPAARDLFTQCVATGVTTFAEYGLARAELTRLNQPASP